MRGQEKRFAPILRTREEIMRALLKFSLGRYLHLSLLLLALVFTFTSCRNDEVEVPPLTGPSGHRLFITMQANPDHLVIHERNRPKESSTITLQLKNQLGQGVPGENIKLRIVNVTGGEINIGTLDKFNVVTDSAGFATATYTAPDASEQPIAIGIRILAILTNPAYPFEVTDTHAIDLERSSINPQPNECVFNTPNGPQADFTFSPLSPVVNETVCFDSQTTTDPTGSIVAVRWSFGDGGTASGEVACHEYDSFGQFTVTLTVQDENRNCDTTSQTITVDRGTPATCQIIVSPSSAEIDEEVLFTALVSDEDGQARRLEWNFGDGSPRVRTSSTTITHSYDTAGTFTVVLTITDDQGNVSFCQATVTVGSALPQCSFTANPTSGNNPLTVNFDASSSSDDTGITSFAWDFGDGGQASGTTVSHTFAADCTAPCSQNFNVTLTVTDEEGQTSSCTQTITVNNP